LDAFALVTDVEGATSLFLDGAVGWNNPTHEADLLIKENPFQYKLATDELIVVSLGTGGVLFKNYIDTFRHSSYMNQRAV
jgi:hypothetical protein